MSFALATASLFAACRGNVPQFGSPPPSFDPASPILIAEDIAFNVDELHVPANEPFTLVFENRDPATHNVAITNIIETFGQGQLKVFFDSAPFAGPSTRWYPVPALAPGRYQFGCSLHSNMTGTLIAS